MDELRDTRIQKHRDDFAMIYDGIRDGRNERASEYVGYKNPIGEVLYNIGVTDERIIRCRNCKHEFEEWGYPYCCRIPTQSFEVDGDSFCSFGEPRGES